MRTIDITPTWGEIGLFYTRLAESGERKAAKAMRKEIARAMAAAQALQGITSTLSAEQNALAGAIIAAEMAKQGYTDQEPKND